MKYRHRYLENLVGAEKGELSALEIEVLDSLNLLEIFSHNLEIELQGSLTFGQRLAAVQAPVIMMSQLRAGK